MSVEKYKATNDKDLFDEVESSNRKYVNEDTIKDIEDKLKKSREEHPLEDVENFSEIDDSEDDDSEDDDNLDEVDLEENSEDENSEDNNSEDNNSEDNNSEDNNSEDNNSEDNNSEDNNSEDNDIDEADLEEDSEDNNLEEDNVEKDLNEIDSKESDLKEDFTKNSNISKEITKDKDIPAKSSEIIIKPALKFLEDLQDPNVVYLGRKKSVLKQYGKIATAYIGKVAENQQEGKQVNIDGLNPHVIFLDGARGTGKSYLLGVIAEELARTNPYIGQIVIDPVGVFWSMKFPNRDSKELKILEEWGLKAEGLKNLKVFVPEGIVSQVSKDTYDDTFSMFPSLLTPEDWCLTFGIERFSPSGLLLEKTLESVKKGYVTGGTKDVPDVKKISAKGNHFTLEDIINCLQNNSEFQSSQKGYKPDSIRALVSRFEAARSWGIFSDSGTPLSKLSRENQLTVLDTSFLDENITALVIGILARRILSARKLLARQEAVKKYGDSTQKAEELLEIEIPPTWMYIDEAHTLIPSGNSQTPATAGIIEYVKQGRRPGCSLVFATQQPSAINTKVLSQVDILISNKLVFNDDISAIQKRMPAIIPKQYKEPNFIKTLPFATALVGDRSEETSRAFILRAAPRRSQHEGRDAETIREIPKKNKSEVLEIAFKMVYEKLEKTKEIKVSFAKDILDVINIKYRGTVEYDELLEKLLEKNVLLKEDLLYLNENFFKEYNQEEKLVSNDSENTDEINSLDENELENIEENLEHVKSSVSKVKVRNTIAERISKANIEEIANQNIKKSLLFKPKEEILNIVLKYRTIYKISYNVYDSQDSFKTNTCFVDSVTGEFIHFLNGEFKISSGLNVLDKINEDYLEILYLLNKQHTLFSLNQETDIEEKDLIEMIDSFKELNLITVKNNSGIDVYKIDSKAFDIPFNPTIKVLSSLDVLPLKKQDVEFLESINYSLNVIQDNLKKLWGEIEFTSLQEIYWPIWQITYNNKEGNRVLKVDAVTGKKM
ncbi:ATP-binding protein [archaeon]|nr:ATP-binding protein [archaeon]NCP98297.1 ATP-binding protein [archaeon]NCQ07399.1 ATP-binding protein [archaeon]